ncbi:hypothetical protein CGC21_7570 [Leishmania donovani]|uniref:Uncharacterized protein n=1 Tax=Leishmania donovani TaxID=5661 RepID=A0A504X6I2_LEIDO|nr:hypothetical protein CGC21_7570 [Leishmania donovani]
MFWVTLIGSRVIMRRSVGDVEFMCNLSSYVSAYVGVSGVAEDFSLTVLTSDGPHRNQLRCWKLVAACSDQHKAQNLSEPYLRVELTAAAQLTALLDHETLKYTLSMAHCISRPTYGRHVKVLMRLLGELRFRILIRDARFFAEHHQSAPSLSRMRGDSAPAAGTTLAASAWHVHQLPAEAYLSSRLMRPSVAHCILLGEQRDRLLGRLQLFEAAHSRVISGTEVLYLCSRLRGYANIAFTEHVTKPPELNPSQVDVAELVTFFTGSGGGALVVEMALTKFFGVVVNRHVRAPELWAMNYLLHWYGVEEGIMLAHEADAVDGGFKQQGGGAFEEQFLIDENKLVVSQVLVPHYCDITRCEEATAMAWVEACVRCEVTEKRETEGASPTWLGTPPVSLPPAYRLARNVNYYWKEAAEDKIGRIAGELDGVIYDAATHHVLFVLEAKQNIAVVGKSFKQKERLYNALDATWKTLSHASQEAALTAVQQSAQNETNTATDTAAGRNATSAVEAACAASTKLRTDPPAANYQDMRNSGDMTAAAAPPARSKAAAARPATAGKPFFTQDNFAAFFGATASVVHSDSTGPSPTPTGSGSMMPQHLGRDQRWIYLTSLSTGNSSGARTTAPAPGGTIHMAELTLVRAACDSVAEAYDSYFQTSTLPPTATPALHARAETAAVSRSDPYEYVLLFRHDVRCKDGRAALEQVRLRENFIDASFFPSTPSS